MKRPPRDLKERLFGRKNLIFGILQGTSVLAVVIFVFIMALRKGEMEARTLTFATLVIANLTLIVANLSWERSIIKTFDSENKALWWVVGGALFSLVLTLYIPVLRDLFHFSVLHFDDIAIVMLTGIFSVLWLKLLSL